MKKLILLVALTASLAIPSFAFAACPAGQVEINGACYQAVAPAAPEPAAELKAEEKAAPAAAEPTEEKKLEASPAPAKPEVSPAPAPKAKAEKKATKDTGNKELEELSECTNGCLLQSSTCYDTVSKADKATAIMQAAQCTLKAQQCLFTCDME